MGRGRGEKGWGEGGEKGKSCFLTHPGLVWPARRILH